MVKKKDKTFKETISKRNITWPEWSDEDINAERWDLTKQINKKKSPVSGTHSMITIGSSNVTIEQFEDLYPVPLPPSLQTKHTWIRASEYSPDAKPVLYASESNVLPDLTSRNEHLLHSEFVRALVSAVHALTYLGQNHPFAVEWETPVFKANTSGTPWRPWHHIYSRGRAGHAYTHAPQLNTLGKYAVRLFWMGCWRKVLVDDRYPVNANNRLLVPASASDPELELWPLLLTKALYKLGSITWSSGHELNHFDIVTCLTGWVGRHIYTSGMEPADIWHICTLHSDHFTYPEVEHTSDVKLPKKSKKETPKSKAVDEGPTSYLFFNCENMRCMDEQAINEVTPCLDHSMLLSEIRDIPLTKADSDQSRILSKWKRIRWEDWSEEMGVWIKDEPPDRIKYMKIVSIFRRIYEQMTEATCTPSFTTQATDSTKLGLNFSPPIMSQMLDTKKSQTDVDALNILDNKKAVMNITLPTRLGTDPKKPSHVQINTELNVTFPYTHKVKENKDKKQKKINQFEEPSVWCSFFKVCDYISTISIYYKPSKFSTSVILSDLKLSSMRQPHTTARTDHTKKETNAPHQDSTRVVQWRDISKKPAREPLYLFIDSVEEKELLFNLTVVGSDLEVARAPPTSVGGSVSESRCPNMVRQDSPCTGHCIATCRGLQNRRTRTEVRVRARYTTRLVIYTWKWLPHQPHSHLCTVTTYGENNFMLNLNKGRHVLTISVRGKKPFILKTFSQTHFKLGTLRHILCPMASESNLLAQFSYGIGVAYAKLLRNLGTPNYSISLREFYQSYKPLVSLNKNDSTFIHTLFLKKFVHMLKRLVPFECNLPFLNALRVLLLNPNIPIPCELNDSFLFKNVETCSECKCIDPRKAKLEDKAATIIQTFFKMVLVKKLKKLQDRTNLDFPEILENLTQIYRIMFCRPIKRSNCVEILRKLHRNLDYSKLNKYYPYAADLETVLNLSKFTGTVKCTERNEWTPITTTVFHCKNKSPILVRIYMFSKLPLYRIRIFNNDTLSEFGTYVNKALTIKCKKNENGYTAVAYGWSKRKAIKRTRWHMYIAHTKLSYHNPITTQNFNMKKRLVSGYYVPNAERLICRCVVKVRGSTPAHFHFTTSTNTVQLILRCVDKNGHVLNSISGIGKVILPLVFLENELNKHLHNFNKTSNFSKQRSTINSPTNKLRNDTQYYKSKTTNSTITLHSTQAYTNLQQAYKRKSELNRNISVISGSTENKTIRESKIQNKTKLTKDKPLKVKVSKYKKRGESPLHEIPIHLNKNSIHLVHSNVNFTEESENSPLQSPVSGKSLNPKDEKEFSQTENKNDDSSFDNINMKLSELIQTRTETSPDFECNLRHYPTRMDVRGESDSNSKSSIKSDTGDVDVPIRPIVRRNAVDYTFLLGSTPFETIKPSQVTKSLNNSTPSNQLQYGTQQMPSKMQPAHKKPSVKLFPKSILKRGNELRKSKQNLNKLDENEESLNVQNHESDSKLGASSVSAPAQNINSISHLYENNELHSHQTDLLQLKNVNEDSFVHQTVKCQSHIHEYAPMKIISQSFKMTSDDENNETFSDETRDRIKQNITKSDIFIEKKVSDKTCDQSKQKMLNFEYSPNSPQTHIFEDSVKLSEHDHNQIPRSESNDSDNYVHTMYKGNNLYKTFPDFDNDSQDQTWKEDSSIPKFLLGTQKHRNDTSHEILEQNKRSKSFHNSCSRDDKNNLHLASEQLNRSSITEKSSRLHSNPKSLQEEGQNGNTNTELKELRSAIDTNKDITLDIYKRQEKKFSTTISKPEQSTCLSNDDPKQSIISRDRLQAILSSDKIEPPFEINTEPITPLKPKPTIKRQRKYIHQKKVCSGKQFCMDYMKLKGYRELMQQLNNPKRMMALPKMEDSSRRTRSLHKNIEIRAKCTDSLIQITDDVETSTIPQPDTVTPKPVRVCSSPLTDRLQNSMEQSLLGPDDDTTTKLDNRLSVLSNSSIQERGTLLKSGRKLEQSNKNISLNKSVENGGSTKKLSTSARWSTQQRSSINKSRLPVTEEEIVEYYIEAYVLNDSWPLTAAEWTVVKKIKSRYNIEEEILNGQVDKETQTQEKSSSMVASSVEKYRLKDTFSELHKGSTVSKESLAENEYITVATMEASFDPHVQFETLTKWIKDAPTRIDAAVNTSDEKIAAPSKTSRLSPQSKIMSNRKLLNVGRKEVAQVKRKLKRPFWTLEVAHESGQVQGVEIDLDMWKRIKLFKSYCFKGNSKKFFKAKHLRQTFLNEHYIKWSDAAPASHYFDGSTDKSSKIDLSQSIEQTYTLYDNAVGFNDTSPVMKRTSRIEQLSTIKNKAYPIFGNDLVSNNSILIGSPRTVETKDKSNLVKSIYNSKNLMSTNSTKTIKKPGECSKCKKDMPTTKETYLKAPDPVDKMLPPFKLNKQKRKSTCRILTETVPQDIYDEIERDKSVYEKVVGESLALVQECNLKTNRQTVQTRAWFNGIRRDGQSMMTDRIAEMTKYVDMSHKKQDVQKLEKDKSKSKRK